MRILVNNQDQGTVDSGAASMGGSLNCITPSLPYITKGGLFGYDYWNQQPIEHKADVYIQDNVVVAEVEMPGFKPEDIQVKLNASTLEIKANRSIKREKIDKTITSERVGVVTVTKSFYIKEKIDTDKIEAAYDAGILTIKLPLLEPAKPTIIDIKVK